MSGARQVKILLDEKTIAERIAELALEIAAAEPKDKDALVRSAPMTTRSAVDKKRDICPVPQPTSTTRASPGMARSSKRANSLRPARATSHRAVRPRNATRIFTNFTRRSS